MEKGRVIVIDDSPTVRKLAELILTEEGYKVYCAENGEDGIRLAEEILPSVILVDFIMPRMNGYQFCKMARCNPFLKDVPIILITAKGEDVGEKFTEKFGVVDYFIKPFQPEQLVEKVNNLLLEQQKAEAAAQEASQEIAAEQSEPTAAEKHFSANIGEDFDRILRRYFYKEFPSMLQKSISDILKQTGVIKTTNITISGDIAEFSLFDIFQLVDTTKATGKLSVFSSGLSSEIYFDKGSIFYASTSKQGVSFLSGDVLERRISISKEDFNKAHKLSKEKGIPILRAFVKEGMATEEQIMDILSEKTYDAIYSAMELENGNFFFEKMPVPEHFSDIKTRIKASQLILEGARRVDERKFAAKMFQDNSIVFIRLMTDVGMEDLNLDKDELKIFSLVDGKRTINDIIKGSGIDEHEAKRIFYTLTKVGILKKK